MMDLKQKQINDLENNIRQNGMTHPIELIKREDGTIVINNGNHRLEVAQKIVLKEVPVKFIGDYVANTSNTEYNITN